MQLLNNQYIIYGLLVINAVTFCIYALDKFYARRSYIRIPETVLLSLALFGGSPAAFLARKIFRHKTSKRSFIIKFRLIVIIQIIGLFFLVKNL
ncbi:MAG: DUF1294 domain-containing protein [Pseudomonadota bacterium]